MLAKTKGIVLGHIKFRESSIITRIFTEEFGIQSYIVNGVRSTKSRTGPALFQPLTLLDLVVYYKENGSIKRISELKCSYPLKQIPFQIQKSAIGIFIAEVLNKTLKEEGPNSELFYFLAQSIISLDQREEEIENFHLKFLVDYSYYLGFKPSSTEDILNNGFSNPGLSDEKYFLDEILNKESAFEKVENFTRRKCLEHLLNFYASHIENFGSLNSTKVLREVFA